MRSYTVCASSRKPRWWSWTAIDTASSTLSSVKGSSPLVVSISKPKTQSHRTPAAPGCGTRRLRRRVVAVGAAALAQHRQDLRLHHAFDAIGILLLGNALLRIETVPALFLILGLPIEFPEVVIVGRLHPVDHGVLDGIDGAPLEPRRRARLQEVLEIVAMQVGMVDHRHGHVEPLLNRAPARIPIGGLE